jgi:hypothetical protein
VVRRQLSSVLRLAQIEPKDVLDDRLDWDVRFDLAAKSLQAVRQL